jgi:hypothetical protein
VPRRHVALGIAVASFAVPAGFRGADTATVYLEQRLGPEGPPGQIVPVLMPVERTLRGQFAAHREVALLVRQGPQPPEWGLGFVGTVEPATRIVAVRRAGATVTVHLAGREPDVYAAAALVYTLTALPGVSQVRLRLESQSCCVYDHDGRALLVTSRATFAGWQGEPCAERTGPDAVRCRPAG